MSLKSVNLNWQHRFRGLIRASHHSLDDDGTALLIRPDLVEARTYQLLCVEPSGEHREVGAVAVETVRGFFPLPDGQMLIGMTADDIYLFRQGRKTRFQPDRRAIYSDVALARNGETFVAAYSDELFSSHGVAYADTAGRLLWHKDLSSQVDRVAIDMVGKRVAVGMHSGRLFCLDHRRNTLWESIQDEPVTALAMGREGARVLAGTEAGTVLSIDHEGGFRWRATVGLPVIAAAVSEEFEWAVAVASNGSSHQLLCFDVDGHPVWETDLEARPTGVSLSPSGAHLLLTFSNGGASLFAVDFSLQQASAAERMAEEARRALHCGDLATARTTLVAALRHSPHRADLGEELLRVEDASLAALRMAAAERRAEGDRRGALEALQQALAFLPWDAELFAECAALRTEALRDLAARAHSNEVERNWDAATELWAEVLSLDPGCVEGRRALQGIREAQAAELLSQGDSNELLGDLEGAMRLWNRAQELANIPAVSERLRTAEIRQCLTAGIAFYEAERMPEAQFQFRKVMALDPDHEEARRYLGYTSSGSEERALISDRFSRLE